MLLANLVMANLGKCIIKDWCVWPPGREGDDVLLKL